MCVSLLVAGRQYSFACDVRCTAGCWQATQYPAAQQQLMQLMCMLSFIVRQVGGNKPATTCWPNARCVQCAISAFQEVQSQSSTCTSWLSVAGKANNHFDSWQCLFAGGQLHWRVRQWLQQCKLLVQSCRRSSRLPSAAAGEWCPR